MTVPEHFPRNSAIPRILVLHYADLGPNDVQTAPGFRYTRPLRTILDVIEVELIRISRLRRQVAFDNRSGLPRFTPGARKANQHVVHLLEEIGRAKGATPAQIALAWLLAQKNWIVPIPGTTKLQRLDENLGAIDVALSAADLSAMESASAKLNVEGARYPEADQKLVGR